MQERDPAKTATALENLKKVALNSQFGRRRCGRMIALAGTRIIMEISFLKLVDT
jgi:hypothetical protein